MSGDYSCPPPFSTDPKHGLPSGYVVLQYSLFMRNIQALMRNEGMGISSLRERRLGRYTPTPAIRFPPRVINGLRAISESVSSSRG